jgi:hypothetical protein
MHTASRFDRRNFLSTAAFSAVALARGDRASATPVSTAQPASSFGDIVAFEGVLHDNSRGVLALEVENELRSIPLAPSATVWRGGDQPLSALRLGDQVLVKVAAGRVERAWANLTRWKGLIVDKTSRGYVGGIGNERGPELLVDPQTRWEESVQRPDNGATGSAARDRRRCHRSRVGRCGTGQSRAIRGVGSTPDLAPDPEQPDDNEKQRNPAGHSVPPALHRIRLLVLLLYWLWSLRDLQYRTE